MRELTIPELQSISAANAEHLLVECYLLLVISAPLLIPTAVIAIDMGFTGAAVFALSNLATCGAVYEAAQVYIA